MRELPLRAPCSLLGAQGRLPQGLPWREHHLPVTGKKGQKQPKGHHWEFSREEYVVVGDEIHVMKVEKCTTPRHKHQTRKTVIRKIARLPISPRASPRVSCSRSWRQKTAAAAAARPACSATAGADASLPAGAPCARSPAVPPAADVIPAVHAGRGRSPPMPPGSATEGSRSLTTGRIFREHLSPLLSSTLAKVQDTGTGTLCISQEPGVCIE